MTGSSTQGIKTVLHPVSDLATAKAVYAAVLGVPPQTDGPYYVGFEAAGPGLTDDERRTIVELMAKGSYARIILATADLDGAFERLQASGADVVQEPAEQPYGVRDCAFRDPAGNEIRISEVR